MPVPPRVDTLLLCDLVIDDRRTGRPTLVGLVDSLYSEEFPTKTPPLVVYARMTGLRGTYRFRAELVGPDLSSVIGAAIARESVFFEDPLRSHAIDLQLAEVLIPEPGRHGIRLLYNDHIAAEIVLPIEGPESLS